MILQLLNKLSGKNEPQKLFPKTSFVRRIYNLIDSGWDIDGIFSVYTPWADIATGSVISLWDPDYCYGLWADETTFAYEIERESSDIKAYPLRFWWVEVSWLYIFQQLVNALTVKWTLQWWVVQHINSSQLAKMKKSIPDMSLPWNL